MIRGRDGEESARAKLQNALVKPAGCTCSISVRNGSGIEWFQDGRCPVPDTEHNAYYFGFV